MSLGPEGGIARDLAAAGFGTFDVTDPASTIRVGEEPASPDNVVTVLNVPGGVPGDVVSEEWLIAVRVRDTSYEAAHSKLRDIAVYLQEKGQGDFGGIRVAVLEPAAAPETLGRDDSRRWRAEQIFRLLLKRSFSFA